MTRVEMIEFANPKGFRPFAIVAIGGLRMEVPHPEFIVIPPGEETSYVEVWKNIGRVSVAKFVELDAIDHIDWETSVKK